MSASRKMIEESNTMRAELNRLHKVHAALTESAQGVINDSMARIRSKDTHICANGVGAFQAVSDIANLINATKPGV